MDTKDIVVNRLRREPLLAGLVAGYVLYSMIVPGLFAIEDRLPEFMDAIPFVLYIIWPYPLALALQTWVEPQGLASNVLVYGVGFLLVAAWAHWLQSRVGTGRPKGWRLVALATWLWVLPLVVLEWSASWGLSILGYSVGE